MSRVSRDHRLLTRDAILLIHGHQLDKSVQLSGPMRASLPMILALKEEIGLGLKLEDEGFARLAAGSKLSVEEICERAAHNWYLTAEEAEAAGLVAAII